MMSINSLSGGSDAIRSNLKYEQKNIGYLITDKSSENAITIYPTSTGELEFDTWCHRPMKERDPRTTARIISSASGRAGTFVVHRSNYDIKRGQKLFDLDPEISIQEHSNIYFNGNRQVLSCGVCYERVGKVTEIKKMARSDRLT